VPKIPYFATPTDVSRRTLQDGLAEWLIEAIGEDTLRDPKARAMRVLEEAVELAQAVGISREKAYEQVDNTYDRPPGEPSQEIAGVINSALLAAEGIGQSGIWLGAQELRRAWRDINLIRAKQRDKVHP
jgi:hypothetical protein